MEPTSILDDVRALLVREIEGMQREISMFPNDASVWETRPGIANPAGNLALHLAGNIRHYIGLMLGGIPYARNRDSEFTRRDVSRLELTSELAAALAVVHDVLPRLTPGQLEAQWPEMPAPVPVTTRRFLLHLCTHAAFHVGQAGYIRRVVTGDSRSSGAVTAARIA